MKKLILTENFKNSINDYFYLIDKNYSYKSTLKIVSDRYRLHSVERTVLFRGVGSKKDVLKRIKKSVDIEFVKKKGVIYIDGYNVLLTIQSYLKGLPLFIGMDGLLRDTAEVHGKISRMKLLNKAIDLLMTFLVSLNPIEVLFYLIPLSVIVKNWLEKCFFFVSNMVFKQRLRC